MTYIKNKILIIKMVKKIKLFKRIPSRKYIKDKALVNFIMQHSIHGKINFPKIKRCSFSKYVHDNKNGCKYLNKNLEIEKKLNNIKIQDFRFSLLGFFSIDKKVEKASFKSFIFN